MCCVCVDCREVARLTGDLLPIVSVYVFFDGIAVSISPVTATDKKASISLKNIKPEVQL